MPKKGKRKAPERSYARLARHERNSRQHWRRIRTNNAIERLNREIRRRTRVVGTFPDGNSALMLVTARLKYVAESEWGSRRYLDVTLLKEALRAVFHGDPAGARGALDRWLAWTCRSRIPLFVELSRKVRRKREGILRASSLACPTPASRR